MDFVIKKTFGYLERNEEKRSEYIKTIGKMDKDNLVYIDESGIDANIAKERGWGKRGVVLHGKRSGKHYKRINIVAGYNNKKILAPIMFDGNFNSLLFQYWVENFLLKELRSGQVVVLDNATFHKSNKVNDLIESVGCSIIFLPPYSPDLNPIEKFWAHMKRWIRAKISDIRPVCDLAISFFESI